MRRPLGALGAAVLAAVSLTACGGSGSGSSGSSNDPQTLLRQTFSSSHSVKSGVLRLDVVVTPHGSSELSTPLSLVLDGPFQTRGAHQTPESNFTITATGLGRSGSFGVISTGSAAYVRLQGDTYALPRSDFQKLRKDLAGNSSSSSAPGLSTLGINPARWLSHPTIVGTQTVDGAPTKQVRAGVNVTALIADLNRLLAREAKTASTAGVPTRIPPATARSIARSVRDPTVDVWTGAKDSILRRLTIGGTVAVSAATSKRLGGLTSADLRLDLGYTQLNQAQTVATPTNVHSYAQLQAKLQSLGAELQTALGATGSTTSGSGTADSAATSKYAKCLNSAGTDVTKMQSCAKLLNGG